MNDTGISKGFVLLFVIVFTFTMVGSFVWDDYLEKYRESLDEICLADEVNVSVNYLNAYNGIFDINHEFNLMVNYRRKNGEPYHLIHTEDVIHVYKEPGSSSIKFTFEDGSSVNVVADFDC